MFNRLRFTPARLGAVEQREALIGLLLTGNPAQRVCLGCATCGMEQE
jgi:hypothetical protein